MKKINLQELAPAEAWAPKGVGFIGDAAMRLVRIEGKFDWHVHAEEEFYLAVSGAVHIDTETETMELREWEGCKVPPGTRHRTRSPGGAVVLMIEPVCCRPCEEDTRG